MSTCQWIEMIVGLLLGAAMIIPAWVILHKATEEEASTRPEDEKKEE